MANFDYFYDSWPIEELQILPGLESDQPFVADDFFLAEKLDPSLIDQWSLPICYQPYPQLESKASPGKHDYELDEQSRPISQTTKKWEQDMSLTQQFSQFLSDMPSLDQLATQPGFLTNPPTFSFPASPISDTRSSPESASAYMWEDEALGETDVDFNLDQFQTSQFQFQQDDASQFPEGFMPLEMPDGSTRLTSNWLPVSPDAGFTVAPPDEQFQDLNLAFFSFEPSSYEG